MLKIKYDECVLLWTTEKVAARFYFWLKFLHFICFLPSLSLSHAHTNLISFYLVSIFIHFHFRFDFIFGLMCSCFSRLDRLDSIQFNPIQPNWTKLSGLAVMFIGYQIGKMYYVFNSNELKDGYPKALTTLGLPASLDKIDAVLVWGHNNRTYFYSGDMYWR